MKLRSCVIATVLAAMVLTGCGAGEKISPQLAMRDAANSTVKAKQGTFTFSIVGAESDLNAVLNEGAKLSEEDRKGLQLLSQSHISLTTAQDMFALDVKVGDVDHAVELRYVGKKVYLRADVPALVKLMGASPDEVNATVDGLAQNGFPFLKDAAAGKWLTADFGAMGDMFKGLAKQLAGGAGAGAPATTPTSAPTASQFKQAKDAIGKALRDNTSIAKQKGDDTGDHYLVTVNSLRGLYAAVLPVISQFPIPGGARAPAASEVPDRPVAIDAWVKGGRIVRIEVPLNQFDTQAPPGRVAVRVDIARDASPVTAPADAVNVDIAGILQKAMQMFLGGMSEIPGMPGLPTGKGIPG
ncbi:MAG TPA: hypothetical protein VGO87_07875 [Acidimicrobiia bacterium]